MYTGYQLNKDQAAALAAFDNSGILSAALEALKGKLMNDTFYTQPHEKIKREEYYMQFQMVDKLKEVIQAAINDSGDLTE